MAPPIVIAPTELERLERAATTEQVSTRGGGLAAQDTNLMAPKKSEPMGDLSSSGSFNPLIDVWADLKDAGPLSDPSELEDELNVIRQLIAEWCPIPCRNGSPDSEEIEESFPTNDSSVNPFTPDECVVLVTLGLGAAVTVGLIWSRYARR